MIVSEDTVSKALAYLAEDPHPLAIAQQEAMFAEKTKDELFAKLYLAAEGAVKERESFVLCSGEHIAARQAYIEAQFAVNRHKQRAKAAENIIEIWRTQNANARAAERVR